MGIVEDMLAFEMTCPDLINQGNLGKFANGRAGEKFECLDTYEDANRAGYRRFGDRSFVIQKVEYFRVPQGVN